MSSVLSIAGALVAAILIASSATMNFLFAKSLGQGAVEGYVLGVVSVALDVLKALLAVSIAKAGASGERTFVIIGSSAFFLITTMSLTASIGFTSSNRSGVIIEREQLNAELRAIEAKIIELRSQKFAIPQHRANAIVEELLSGMRHDRRWRETSECATAKTSAAQLFCDGVSLLRTERAAAMEAMRLAELITFEEGRASQLRRTGGGREGDPQARLLAAIIGSDEGHARRLLMAMVALVVEIVSGLAIYLINGPRKKSVEIEASIPEPPILSPKILPADVKLVVAAGSKLGDRRRPRSE